MTKHNVTLPSCSDYVSEHPTVQAHYEALMKYNADVTHYVVWTDKSGLMGLKDQYGNALLLPLYEEIIPLNINTYVVKQKGKYGAIRGGKQVVDCTMAVSYTHLPSTLTRTTSSADSSSPRSSMQTAMAYLVGCSDIGSGDATGGSHGNTTA